jgi:hypothetical protein
VHEHIFAAVFTLDEAKALLAVEELDDALALANDLSRHTAASTTATGPTAGAAEAAATTTGSTAAEAATAASPITAAEATAVTTAEATTTATEAATITAEAAAITAAKAITCERIETLFAKSVALVPALAATPSIKTHIPERTFASP